MLKLRLPFGIAFVALVFGAMWLDQWLDGLAAPRWWPRPFLDQAATLPPALVLVPVLLLLGVMAARELGRILREKGVAASTVLTCGLAVVGLLLTAVSPTGADAFTGVMTAHTAMGLVLVGSLAYYARNKQVEGMVAAAGGALLAYAYIGVLLGFLCAIRREHTAWVLLWVLLVTKSCDIGAYTTGRTIGKHKLAPWLSPGKTWEGLWGGVAFSAVIGAVGVWILNETDGWGAGIGPVGLWFGAVCGGVFAFVGQFGDLLASLLKRDAGRKDMGHSLPGFGGVLDVLDSVLLVAPLAFWILAWPS